MNKKVNVQKISGEPERFVLVIPPYGREPQLVLGPFSEKVIREELGKFGTKEESASREITNARNEFEKTERTDVEAMAAVPSPAPEKMSPPKRPRLIITRSKNGIPIEARCSNCSDILFHLSFTNPSLEEHLRTFKAMFDRHVRSVHADLCEVE